MDYDRILNICEVIFYYVYVKVGILEIFFNSFRGSKDDSFYFIVVMW